MNSWTRSEQLSALRALEADMVRRRHLASSRAIWTPLPGPQTEALNSSADILLYGGSAGGGKSDCLLGASITQHRTSIIFRREYSQLKGIKRRAEELLYRHGRFSGKNETWYLSDGRLIEFGAVQREVDVNKYQGRPHDLKGFDELTAFTEAQFRFLIGWNRNADYPDQRTRVIATCNPPTDAVGDWVLSYWGPWLDVHHPNPARPGELRWYATVPDDSGGSRDLEVPDGRHFVLVNNRPCYDFDPADYDAVQIIRPQSRTFIPARVTDNPYLASTRYVSVLQGLPEPLRSKMLLGDWMAGHQDDANQVIPTAWVRAAQQRWEPLTPGFLDTAGVDVARGGKDKTVISPKCGPWLGKQISLPGRETPDAPTTLREIVAAIPSGHRPVLQIDVIGVGSAVYDYADAQGFPVRGLNSAQGSTARDRAGQLTFANKRAEWWWTFREMLDPQHGEEIALPPDRELLADLTAPRWKFTARGVVIESKDEVRERIGRSPDKGDSCIYAFARPPLPPQRQFI